MKSSASNYSRFSGIWQRSVIPGFTEGSTIPPGLKGIQMNTQQLRWAWWDDFHSLPACVKREQYNCSFLCILIWTTRFCLECAQMDDLAKLLSDKINQLSDQSHQEVAKRSTQQRALAPQEVNTALTNCEKKTFMADVGGAIAAMFTLLKL